MRTSLRRTVQTLAVIGGMTVATGLVAAPAHAEARCYGGLTCVKSQKFADNLTGADIGLRPIAQAKFSNYTDAPVKKTMTVKAGTAIMSHTSGDLTFGGDVKLVNVQASLGMAVDKTATTDVTEAVEATVKPGETWYLECFGYYAKYEVRHMKRVLGDNNDVTLGVQYFYPPVQNTLYCRSRKK